MKRMKVAICDDNEACIEDIIENINRFGLKNVVCDSFLSGEDLLKEYTQKGTYDLVFLDVEMGGINGIKVGEQIRSIDVHTIIVFITSYSAYVRRCFDSMPFRFLLKPIDESEFDEMFTIACKRIEERPRAYTIENRKETVRLYADDIISFESQDHVVNVYTTSGEFKIHRPMNELENLFNDENFCRVHRSFIVNFKYISKIFDESVEMRDIGHKIPIGRKYKKRLKENFSKYLEGEFVL